MRFHIVLRHAPTRAIQLSEVVLCVCVSLLSRFAIPRLRLCVVLRNALPAGIRTPKQELGEFVSPSVDTEIRPLIDTAKPAIN